MQGNFDPTKTTKELRIDFFKLAQEYNGNMPQRIKDEYREAYCEAAKREIAEERRKRAAFEIKETDDCDADGKT